MVVARRWSAADAAAHISMPTATDDKYSRGVVGMRTGSDAYPGAAVLGVEAAWRTGIGMVRYVGADRAAQLVLQRRPETVTRDGRVQAWVIGSGTDAASRPEADTLALRGILDAAVPVVVDAGALDLVVGARAALIATPHAGEFARLQARLGLTSTGSREGDVVHTAAKLGHTVLLKGAQTLVATPAGEVIVVESGTPWLAGAGTGDVLAGVIGALVAANAARGALDASALAALAASGAWLHGAAARVAAGQGTSVEVAADRPPASPGHPLVALDVATALSSVVGALLAGRR